MFRFPRLLLESLFHRLLSAGVAPVRTSVLALFAGIGLAGEAGAFSEIPSAGGNSQLRREGIESLPLPPVRTSPDMRESEPRQDERPAGPDEPRRNDVNPERPGAAEPATERGTQVEEPAASESRIAYGEADLPAPVRDLRRRLIEIARSGDVEAMRSYIERGPEETTITFGETPDDPIAFFREATVDGEGIELMAILLEVLEAGYAVGDPGTERELYVWPYFAQINLETLTRRQMVELFELVTASDYHAMLQFGAYNFYRVGISPDGRLRFFVSGD